VKALPDRADRSNDEAAPGFRAAPGTRARQYQILKETSVETRPQPNKAIQRVRGTLLAGSIASGSSVP